MRLEDLGQVMNIDRTSFSLPWPESAYRYELKNPKSLLWITEIGTPDSTPLIVGMIVIWLILEEGHIATLAVHSEYRNQGIAQELLSVALKAAIRRGIQKATLEVRAQNLPAQQLYQRFGFEIVGHRVRYYRDNNEDALIMTASGLDDTYLQWLEGMGWKNDKKE
jgi:ribosomal-protein-alanine N-acetyltransferase